jgi:hypothetical protein
MEHAEREMRRAGLYDKGTAYDGMSPEAVMALVKAHSEQGHSGGSHEITLQVFDRVIRYKTLTPITSDPTEWMEVGTDVWQNNRDSSYFSTDGGKTWYNIYDPKKKNWPKRKRQSLFGRIFGKKTVSKPLQGADACCEGKHAEEPKQ